jgi:hypothetical protein
LAENGAPNSSNSSSHEITGTRTNITGSSSGSARSSSTWRDLPRIQCPRVGRRLPLRTNPLPCLRNGRLPRLPGTAAARPFAAPDPLCRLAPFRLAHTRPHDQMRLLMRQMQHMLLDLMLAMVDLLCRCLMCALLPHEFHSGLVDLKLIPMVLCAGSCPLLQMNLLIYRLPWMIHSGKQPWMTNFKLFRIIIVDTCSSASRHKCY